MATASALNSITMVSLDIPTIELKKLKGIAKAMGWTLTSIEKKDDTSYIESSPKMLDIISQGKKEILEGKGVSVSIDDLWK